MSDSHSNPQSQSEHPSIESQKVNEDQPNISSASSPQQENNSSTTPYTELQNAEQMYRDAKIAQEKELWSEAAELFSKSLEIRFDISFSIWLIEHNFSSLIDSIFHITSF
jgi:hypothetical protein